MRGVGTTGYDSRLLKTALRGECEPGGEKGEATGVAGILNGVRGCGGAGNEGPCRGMGTKKDPALCFQNAGP